MQTSCQGTKAYHSENVTYDLGTFTANKVNSIWFFDSDPRTGCLDFSKGFGRMQFDPA